MDVRDELLTAHEGHVIELEPYLDTPLGSIAQTPGRVLLEPSVAQRVCLGLLLSLDRAHLAEQRSVFCRVWDAVAENLASAVLGSLRPLVLRRLDERGDKVRIVGDPFELEPIGGDVSKLAIDPYTDI
ncbi:MAG: hypothetical protein U1E22_01195 [Coriobacteriia bacterium]|nr:hypothetical protein [Coriobacteriia bacterium]